MRFPEKYIKSGERILHSGGQTNVFYDVNALLTDAPYVNYLLDKISFSEHYIGVATGGAIIAALVSKDRKGKFSMIKDGELKGETPWESWVLIDDVATTGSSLEEAIKIVGKTPSKIVVAVDRREVNKNPVVNSIFEI